MKLDLHIHTIYSKHSLLSLEKLKKLEFKTGIKPVITDHAVISGNKKYRCVICAEEITTKQGDVLAYFIHEAIPNHLDIFETIDRVREQGGLIALPHPFDIFRKERLDYRYINKINWDFIEVFNGFTFFNKQNKMAYDLAKKLRKPMCVGSDNHTAFGYGRTYVEMDEFSSKKEFMQNLKKANLVAKRLPLAAFLSVPVMHLRTLFVK